MNWKNRLTNYNFWISIVSAILLILQAFKIEFDVAYINEILTGILGLLVVIGIISDPTKIAMKSIEKTEKKSKKEEEKQENSLPIENENESDNGNSQIDFQAVVDKISADLNEISLKLEKNNNIENIEQIENVEEQPKIDEILENQVTLEENFENVTNEEPAQISSEEIKTDSTIDAAETQESEIPTHYNIVN